jgi:hypothetical protein
MREKNDDSFSAVLFSDEANLHVNGEMNSQKLEKLVKRESTLVLQKQRARNPDINGMMWFMGYEYHWSILFNSIVNKENCIHMLRNVMYLEAVQYGSFKMTPRNSASLAG